MTTTIVAIILLFAFFGCLVGAWISNARWTRELDQWGKIYNCERWPQEANYDYFMRLRARIRKP